MTPLDFITINGSQIRKPANFKPKREDIYAGEYETCTGAIVADRIGWKYSDISLDWDALTQEEVDILIGLNGEFPIIFDDMDGDTQTEKAIRSSIVSLRHRNTIDGVTWWRNVQVSIRFISSHTDD